MSLDTASRLSDGVIALSPLVAQDEAALTEAAADPLIWEQHPSKDRWRPDVFAPYFAFLLARGGTLVAREVAGGAVIGCSRYYPVPDAPEDIGIGFTFLVRQHWGGAMNLRMKTLMLDHAFGAVNAVWFHIGPDNIRSQKGTAKLGAARVADRRLDLAGADADWVTYRLDRQAWTRHAPVS